MTSGAIFPLQPAIDEVQRQFYVHQPTHGHSGDGWIQIKVFFVDEEDMLGFTLS